jgi:anion-transporting  ArsA/GET3 family ATPase
MSVSNIVFIASSNIDFYNSIHNRDEYYEKMIDKTIILSSDIMDKIQHMIDIDFEIIAFHESLTSIEKNLKELQKDLTNATQYKFIIITHCIKINKQLKNEYIHKIHYLNNIKNDIYKEIQPTEDKYIERNLFSINRTNRESNKLRLILQTENKKSYLMNMSLESRNKKKNNREINKLLFGEIKSSKKHNKIRKTKPPNNKFNYY